MSFDRICPKCECTDFVKLQRGNGWAVLGFLRMVDVIVLACVECGHLEENVAPHHLEKLRQHGKRVCN